LFGCKSVKKSSSENIIIPIKKFKMMEYIIKEYYKINIIEKNKNVFLELNEEKTLFRVIWKDEKGNIVKVLYFEANLGT
jgi:hypothetical protein